MDQVKSITSSMFISPVKKPAAGARAAAAATASRVVILVKHNGCRLIIIKKMNNA